MSIWTRPTDDETLDDRQTADEVTFIGQDHIKQQVEPFMAAEKFPHVLLTGDPGLGKTQFAKWVAGRRGKPFFEKLAPAKPMELPPYGILLLDEVHRQSDVEALFPTMDRGLLTIIAATTKPERLDSAFKSRFLVTLRLRKYTTEQIEQIMGHMSDGAADNPDFINVLANACDGNPRVAERITRTAMSLGTWDPETVLQAVQITADGLQQDHFDYLGALKHLNRPAGKKQLGDIAVLSDDEIKRVERLLVDKGYVELTSNGRKLSVRGKQYVSLLEDEGVL